MTPEQVATFRRALTAEDLRDPAQAARLVRVLGDEATIARCRGVALRCAILRDMARARLDEASAAAYGHAVDLLVEAFG